VLDSEATALMMSEHLQGERQSNVFHARIGDGYSLVLDLAIKMDGSLSPKRNAKKVNNNKVTRPAPFHNTRNSSSLKNGAPLPTACIVYDRPDPNDLTECCGVRDGVTCGRRKPHPDDTNKRWQWWVEPSEKGSGKKFCNMCYCALRKVGSWK
jgi:hypothetical protein